MHSKHLYFPLSRRHFIKGAAAGAVPTHLQEMQAQMDRVLNA